MALSDIAKALADQGLIDAETAAEVGRLEAMQDQGGVVDQGDVIPLDELQAMADITPADIARAAADWQETTPLWARGLLDCKPVDVL